MRTAIAVFFALVATTAHAQQTRGLIYVPNPSECGGYLQKRAVEPDIRASVYAQVVAWWAKGWIGHYNFVARGAAEVEPPSSETIVAYLDKYCRDNPLGNTVEALKSLLADIGGRDPSSTPKR